MSIILFVLFIALYIFRLVDAIIIPNCILLLLISSLMIIVPAVFLKVVQWKWKISVIVISFIFACFNWIYVSYNSFYDGVAFNLYNEANILYTSTSTILKSNITENEKKFYYQIFTQNLMEKLLLKKMKNPLSLMNQKDLKINTNFNQ